MAGEKLSMASLPEQRRGSGRRRGRSPVRGGGPRLREERLRRGRGRNADVNAQQARSVGGQCLGVSAANLCRSSRRPVRKRLRGRQKAITDSRAAAKRSSRSIQDWRTGRAHAGGRGMLRTSRTSRVAGDPCKLLSLSEPIPPGAYRCNWRRGPDSRRPCRSFAKRG